MRVDSDTAGIFFTAVPAWYQLGTRLVLGGISLEMTWYVASVTDDVFHSVCSRRQVFADWLRADSRITEHSGIAQQSRSKFKHFDSGEWLLYLLVNSELANEEALSVLQRSGTRCGNSIGIRSKPVADSQDSVTLCGQHRLQPLGFIRRFTSKNGNC